MTAAAELALAPGLYDDITDDEYHADPSDVISLSHSLAHVLITKSPLHAHLAHPRLGGGAPRKTTAAMTRGQIIHKLLLGRGRDFLEIEEADYKSNRARAAKEGAIADGLIPLLSSELEEYSAAAGIYRAKLRARREPIEFKGPTELTGIFNFGGARCRMRIDHWNGDELIIDDIKSCMSANPRDIARSMVTYGSDIQAETYTDGIGALIPEAADRVRMRFIFLEEAPPYDVVVIEPSGKMRELGRRRWKRAVETWIRCITANDWPGYASETIRLDPPAYALAADAEHDMYAMATPEPPPF